MMVFSFFIEQYDIIIRETLNHLMMVFSAVPLAVILAVPLSIWVSSKPVLSEFVLSLSGILLTIPALALFGLSIVLLSPFRLGIGMPSAVFALTVYSFVPVLRNTVVALQTVDPAHIEAARGMGLKSFQILIYVRLPLALPLLMAGIRQAVVLCVSIATIAYLVGAGGIGYFIFSGLSRTRMDMVLSGALIVSVLGIVLNLLLLKAEKLMTSEGLKMTRNKLDNYEY